MKYDYLITICKPEAMEKCLQDYGAKGYRFIQAIVLQKYITTVLGQQPKVETEFKLIFELSCQESAT